MKASVKTQNFEIGSKLYWSEGIEEKYYRGEIIASLKIAVRVKALDGSIETIEKRNCGIVVCPDGTVITK